MTEDRIKNYYIKSNDIYNSKHKLYGFTWTNWALTTLTDKCLGKIHKIKNVMTKGVIKANDSIESELIGIINYSKKYLVKLSLAQNIDNITLDYVNNSFTKTLDSIIPLYHLKNHDYDDIWMKFRTMSIIDGIYGRIERIQEMEIDVVTNMDDIIENYKDIIIECVFALIKLDVDRNEL